MQETLNSKKHGDTAFRAKDFATAIECYTQVSIHSLHFDLANFGFPIFFSIIYKQPNLVIQKWPLRL